MTQCANCASLASMCAQLAARVATLEAALEAAVAAAPAVDVMDSDGDVKHEPLELSEPLAESPEQSDSVRLPELLDDGDSFGDVADCGAELPTWPLSDLAEEFKSFPVTKSQRDQVHRRVREFQLAAQAQAESADSVKAAADLAKAETRLVRSVLRSLISDDEFIATNFTGRKSSSSCGPAQAAACPAKISLAKDFCHSAAGLKVSRESLQRAYKQCRETALLARKPDLREARRVRTAVWKRSRKAAVACGASVSVEPAPYGDLSSSHISTDSTS